MSRRKGATMPKKFEVVAREEVPTRTYNGTVSGRFFDEIVDILRNEEVAVKVPLTELKGPTAERKRAGLGSRLRARGGRGAFGTRLDHEAGVVWVWRK